MFEDDVRANACGAPDGATALSVDSVGRFVSAVVTPVRGTERVPLAHAVGRSLAADLVAPMPLPAFDHAAVDGYALQEAHLGAHGVALPVTGRLRAGDALPDAGAGVLRVLTGAPVPVAVSAVVMQEHVRRADGAIMLGDAVRPGANIRRRGEDVAVGERLCRAGDRLDSRHVALLAALGFAEVTVRRRIRAAVLAFGNELAAPGGPRTDAQIYDSNSPLAAAFLARHGVEITACDRVPDGANRAQSAFARHAGSVDLIVTSGGMADGDEDHTRAALEALGGRWRTLSVRMKPGKPAAFGALDGSVVLGLPGNPFAALAAFVVIGRPILAALGGTVDGARPLLARACFELTRRAGRTEFFPARRMNRDDAPLTIDRLGKGGSARLRPLIEADGLGMIDAARNRIAHGDPVGFIGFEGLL